MRWLASGWWLPIYCALLLGLDTGLHKIGLWPGVFAFWTPATIGLAGIGIYFNKRYGGGDEAEDGV